MPEPTILPKPEPEVPPQPGAEATPHPEPDAPPVPALWREERPVVEPGATPPPPVKTRRIRWRLGLAAVLAAGLVVLLYWLRPIQRAALVPLWVNDYPNSSLPPVPQAARDRDALLGGDYLVRTNKETPTLDGTHLLQELGALQDRQAEMPVVVYLCGRAGRGEHGEMLFFTADAGPERPQSAVPVRAVLEALRACPARHKLLVLDVMWPFANPALGLLGDETAVNVQGELDAVDDPRRLVLCSCSPGQTAQASPELGRTVFGFYFEQGLRGWADGYGPSGARDGRISVHELADFTQGRVARWAARNRQAPQVPMLLGTGDDFTLVTLQRRNPLAPVPPAAAESYPDWLTEAWQGREKWWNEGRQHVAARLLRQRDAVLLDAERDWQAGLDAEHVRDACRARLARLEKEYEQTKSLPTPEPRSLALAAMQGQKPDPAVTVALKELLTRPQPAPAPDKPGDPPSKRASDFLTKFKDKSYFEVASAAFTVAIEDRELTPDKVRLLNLILHTLEPQPRFVETLFLQRLEDLAAATDVWPRDTVHRALEVIRAGEKAAARADSFPRLRDWLEEAAQKRHDGEWILMARGYAPLAEAERLLREAGEEYETLLQTQDAFAQAQRALDDALVFLPAYPAYLDRQPQNEPAWLTANAASEDLAAELAAPTGDAVPGKPGGLGELRRAAQTVLRRTEYLQEHLDDLRLPFTTEGLASGLEAAARPSAGPSLIADLDGVLATPFLTAADRKTVWEADRGLARRLNEDTLKQDEEEDRRKQPAFRPSGSASERDEDLTAARDRAARRARWSAAVLRLGGLTVPDALAVKPGNPPVDAGVLQEMSSSLRRAWSEQLPAQLRQETNPFLRDRLGRVFPPLTSLPLLDDRRTNPQVQRRTQETQALWGWLASRFRYEVRDGGEATFYEAAVGEYARVAGPLPAEIYLDLAGTPEPFRFTPGNLSGVYQLDVTTVGVNADPQAAVRILKPDDTWLRVDAQKPENSEATPSPASAATRQLAFRLELLPGAERAGVLPPRGALVEAWLQGRAFHRLLPVAMPWTPDQVDVFLAVTPDNPETAFTELRLRPVKGESYYLYVRNPSARTRNLAVQLKAGGAAVAGGEAKLTVEAKTTKRVTFAAAAAAPPPPPVPAPPAGGATPTATAAPPTAEWPELHGPLEVQVVDADNKNAVVADQRIDVRLARAWDYAQVSDIRFFPPGAAPGGKNRLEVHLRALRPLSGPPCIVELALPGDLIPGFLGSAKGTFRGELPPDGKELLLFAEDILFAEGTDEQGMVYLTVDGRERAYVFSTTFSRDGNVTIPRQDRTPALRIGVGRFAPTDPREMVGVQVDNPPDGASLEVDLGQFQGQTFYSQSTIKHSTPYLRRITFTPSGPGGALLFEASEKDWTAPFDTSKTVGQRVVRARLLDSQGTEVRSVTQQITVDDTPPEAVRFISLPESVKHGTTVTLKAAGMDPESGISQVVFFLGKPLDKKVPPNTAVLTAQPQDKRKTVWAAQLPTPADKKGPLEISVRFVNGAGLDTFATGTIELTEADPVPLGKIRGTVVEGPRPQADLEVFLYDEKGAEKAKTKTDGEGIFVFEGLAPGNYKVRSTKQGNATPRKGAADVKVTAGGVATATIELSL